MTDHERFMLYHHQRLDAIEREKANNIEYEKCVKVDMSEVRKDIEHRVSEAKRFSQNLFRQKEKGIDMKTAATPSNKRTIYIISKMRGIPYFNYEAIDECAAWLRNLGWIVISPADEDRNVGFDANSLPGNTDWNVWPEGHLSKDDTIERCLRSIVKHADSVYVLTQEDELGSGGKAELAVARWLGLDVYRAQDDDAPFPKNFPRTLLGIHGLAGSGKDTLADYIIKESNHLEGDLEVYEAANLAFKYSLALPMKLIATTIFGFTCEQMRDQTLKEREDPFWGVTPRRFLQLLGTDMFRDKFRDDVWLKLAERKRREFPNSLMVIPDIRFKNEAEWLKRNGGILVEIVRDKKKLVIGDAALKHSSEGGIPKGLVDLTFDNNGSLDDLRRFAVALANQLLCGDIPKQESNHTDDYAWETPGEVNKDPFPDNDHGYGSKPEMVGRLSGRKRREAPPVEREP